MKRDRREFLGRLAFAIALVVGFPVLSMLELAQPVVAQSVGPVVGNGPGAIGPPVASNNGNVSFGNGNIPTINASCGTGATIAGTDSAFSLTTGTSATSACRIAFAQTWNQRPVCSIDPSTVLSTATITTSSVTLTGGTIDGATYDFVCIGRPGG